MQLQLHHGQQTHLSAHLGARRRDGRLPAGHRRQRVARARVLVAGWQRAAEVLLHGCQLAQEAVQHGLDLVAERILAALEAHSRIIQASLCCTRKRRTHAFGGKAAA